MSVTIEQDQEHVKLAYAFQRQVDVNSILVVDAHIMCSARPEEVSFPLTTMLHHEAEEATRLNRIVTVPVKFGFKALTKETPPREIVVVNCKLLADYTLTTEDYEPSLAEIEAFGESNAIFNCWPYFRELVQTAVTRMGYPPFSLPFLRLVPKPSRKVEPPEATLELAPSSAPADTAVPQISGAETATQKKKRRKSRE